MLGRTLEAMLRDDTEFLTLSFEVFTLSRRNPEIARISASFDADVRKWLGDLFRAAVAR